MKKFLSVALCIFMLLSVMLSVVSAEDVKYKIDARFLREYGQTVYFVENTETAPIIDGSVQANEYDVKAETRFDNDKEYDLIDDSVLGGTFGLEWANYYLSVDEECLYIAAEIYDNCPTQYNQWPEVPKRADQFAFALGGMIDTPDPMGIASRIEFRFFDGNSEENKAATGHEDFFEIQDLEKDFMGQNVTGDSLDVATFTKAHVVNHNPDTKVTTYEVAIKWDAVESIWPHQEGNLQFKLMTFGAYAQDTSDELLPDKNVGSKTGIKWWGVVGEEAYTIYDELMNEYTSAAYYGWHSNDKLIPNMFFRGTEEEYNAFMAERLVEDLPETEAPETDEVEDETDAPATEAPSDDKTDDDKKPADSTDKAEGGCGSSVAAMGVALVAALGTCVTFINKKR